MYVWEINKCKDFKVVTNLHFEVQLSPCISTPVFLTGQAGWLFTVLQCVDFLAEKMAVSNRHLLQE